MTTRFMRHWLVAAAFAGTATALASGTDAAGVPGTVTHQGRLYDSSDKPINSNLKVVFALYATPNAATPVWSEDDQVTFDEGYFSVNLGETAPFPTGLFSGAVLYLGITVGTDPEMTPRPPVQSVPYALVAGDVLGDIHPTSISINGAVVIDGTGKWVGTMTGIQGPTGPMGTYPQGVAFDGTNIWVTNQSSNSVSRL